MVADTFEQAYPQARILKLRKDKATEGVVAGEVGRHRFVHLATHGFFAPTTLGSTMEPGSAREGQEDSGHPAASLTAWHPGLLSGIVLAGANREPRPDRDDGILTALELATLDFRNTELLVLSACETGLGGTAGGEGLLGLQRAAQIAGARTTVATLWQVDDQDAQALVARFYENLWTRKMSKVEALRQAQLALLRGSIGRGPGALAKAPRAEGAFRVHPRAWAAWVLSGDWR
jgi:CHAT domain-containing protein